MSVSYMTQEGLQRLKDELRKLENEERPKIIKAIAEAREKGDLSENAEYDAAKEAQGILEQRIASLKEKIVSARVLEGKAIKTDVVQILTRVKIRNKTTRQEKVYQIVNESEANSKEGKIAVSTPIARGLIGKKVGEVATIDIPAGRIDFEILEISL